MIELDPIGEIVYGNCRTLELTGEINSIKASVGANKVKSVRFIKGTTSLEFGTLHSTQKEWLFDENNVLIGVYGHSNGPVINEIGFITLDLECLSQPDPEVVRIRLEQIEEEKFKLSMSIIIGLTVIVILSWIIFATAVIWFNQKHEDIVEEEEKQIDKMIPISVQIHFYDEFDI